MSVKRAWTIATNAIMMAGWVRVVVHIILLTFMWNNDNNDTIIMLPTVEDCREQLTPKIKLALYLSFLELLNAIVGVTRSKPASVLLFSVIRWSVEVYLTPLLAQSCASPLHLLTVACWSLGDTIRMGCFFLDNVVSGSRLPKSIRYTAGPILFPLGALGEMAMVVAAANQRESVSAKYGLYVAACLWPAGFYPLYRQLLRQRRRFFRKKEETGGGAKTKMV